MSIIRKSPITKLFGDLKPIKTEPQVHNKYHRSAPEDAVDIMRGTDYGNPYVIGRDGTRAEVIELFRIHKLPRINLKPLKGKHLLCCCKPAACHGDLLLEAANK